MARRPLVAGNWKMNGTLGDLAEVEVVRDSLPGAAPEILVCPPATLLAATAERLVGSAVGVGGQDCHAAPGGAHTGDLSAEMLADAGARAVILGHSERRADHGETDAEVRAKIEAAWRAGLAPILCVGETEAERDAGRALEVVAAQVDASLPDGADHREIAVAYEPVWAIGSGRTPGSGDIAEMHSALREQLAARLGARAADEVRVLYGGSVKPGNADDIAAVPGVDGALVGGASLAGESFLPIISAFAGRG
jgi:triosephosphate isomerase